MVTQKRKKRNETKGRQQFKSHATSFMGLSDGTHLAGLDFDV
jgi:hypothetical protein